MTQLTVDTDDLSARLEDAIDIDTTIEVKGTETEMPESTVNSIQKRNVAGVIAEYLSEVAMESPLIDSTTFAPGSGDTGRQSKVVFTPHDDVEKDQLIELGEELDKLLSELDIFPFTYMINVAHKMGIDEEGYPQDRDEFHLSFTYSSRSHGGPQRPATEHTVIH